MAVVTLKSLCRSVFEDGSSCSGSTSSVQEDYFIQQIAEARAHLHLSEPQPEQESSHAPLRHHQASKRTKPVATYATAAYFVLSRNIGATQDEMDMLEELLPQENDRNRVLLPHFTTTDKPSTQTGAHDETGVQELCLHRYVGSEHKCQFSCSYSSIPTHTNNGDGQKIPHETEKTCCTYISSVCKVSSSAPASGSTFPVDRYFDLDLFEREKQQSRSSAAPQASAGCKMTEKAQSIL